jgi:hypothetical protein
MGSILLASVMAFALVTVIAVVWARVTRAWWRGSPHLGIGFAVIGVAVTCWVQFLATWLSPNLGALVAVVLGAGFLIAFGAFRLWRWLRAELGLLLVAAGLLAAYLGLTFLWVTAPTDGFSLAALRFSFHDQPYPIDNMIPTLLSNRLHEGGSTHALVLAWNGSDRPPLQSGGILLAQELFAGVPLEWWAPSMAVGMVLQLLWVPALWALLRFAGVSARISALTTAFAGATATMLINTTYTWPKLLSAALVIVAIMLLLAVITRRLGVLVALPVAALAMALAALAHGAAVFSLPAIAILAIMALRRGGRWLLACVISAVTVVVAYVPWLYYQRVVDPPGDRLLKWHLAGETGITDRSVVDEIVHAYSSIDFGQWLDARLTNLGTIFSPALFTGFDGTGDDAIGARRFHEYYETSAALSVGALLIVGVVIACVVILVRRRPLRNRMLLFVALLMLPCLAFWWLVMFQTGGTVVHQGSHVWILLLIALPFAWIAVRHRWLALAALTLQVALTAWFYIPFFGESQLRPSAVVVGLLGCALVAAGVVLARPRAGVRPVGAEVEDDAEDGARVGEALTVQ